MMKQYKPISVVDVLSRVAPGALAPKLEAGPGFAAWQVENSSEWTLVSAMDSREIEAGLCDWSLLSVCETAQETWEFIYESSSESRALCRVQLDPAYNAAVYQVRLTNRSGRPSQSITRISPISLWLTNLESLPRVMSSTGARYLHSANTYPVRHAFWVKSDVLLKHNGVTFSSDLNDGHSCGKDLPLFLVSSGPEWNAPGFFFGMEWSGMWDAVIHSYGGNAFRCGQTKDNYISSAAPNTLLVNTGLGTKDLVLEPGESIDLPNVHIGFFEEGFEAGTNACRRYLRERIAPRHGGDCAIPPVACVQWPGIRKYVEEDIYRQVDAAADLGAEVFIMDTEWMGPHPSNIGNWEADTRNLPRGLEPLSENVRAKGMELGVFFGGEAAGPGTRMLREHPEFFHPFDVGGHVPEGFRLINYSLPDARDYVVELLGDLIERWKLTCVHWELDAAPISVLKLVDPTGKLQFTHLAGLYQALDELMSRFSNLRIWYNSVGNHRLDLGMMKRSHFGWCYEVQACPHFCRRIQLSGNQLLPSHLLGANVGPWPLKDHSVLDEGLPDLSFISRMAGTLFINGRLFELTDEERGRAKHWIRVFKNIRSLIVKNYYRLLPQPQSEADWDAGQFCDGSRSGLVFVFRYFGRTDRQNLFLRCIDRNRDYRFRDEQSGEEIAYAGDALLDRGFPVELSANSAKLFTYE